MKRSSPVDQYVGSRLRMLRKKHQLSQSKLALSLDLSHQQIQQYELGRSRISAGTLYELAIALDVPVTYFFEGIQINLKNYSEMLNSSMVIERQTPINILLVESDAEDEIKFRKALIECRQQSNLYVENSGVDALDFLRGIRKSDVFQRPEIIILDLNVTKKDGGLVLKEIKSDRSLADIPIIMMSTSADHTDITQLYNHHANGFIRKSYDQKKFDENVALIVKYWSANILPSMQETYRECYDY